MTQDDALDAAFAALAHPTRRAILARLAHGEATVNTLAEPLDMSLPAVSRHIKVLEGAGLISRSQKAQTRPCKINANPLRDVADWTNAYRPIWEARFDIMDNLLKQMKDSGHD